MKRLIQLLAVILWVGSANAATFSHRFLSVPLSEALATVADCHPEVHINFIYNELDKYRVTVEVNTDDAYDALRHIVGLNPVSVMKRDNRFYVEALQHGRFIYTGQVAGTDGEPVVAATVMLLAPADSVVVTYGITDADGRFSIPCDVRDVVAKVTCLGYRQTFEAASGFSFGTITMRELPILLKSVKVEAENASLYSDKSVFRPTGRQKRAAQTATELLARMAIPQLNVMLGSSSVTTVSGQPVAVYINSVPATPDELRMMRLTDVKSVEYLEHSSDPRFRGNRHVVNFVMAQYEYGGYVKLLGNEKFIANSGFVQGNARLVHKKMTYDLMGYGYYSDNGHSGLDQTERFRLPQADGTSRTFERMLSTESSKYRRQNYETSFRAMYASDRITANNQLSFGVERNPNNDNAGLVAYSDEVYPETRFNSAANSDAWTLGFNGYYFFSLPHNNSLSADIGYSCSGTRQHSIYSENGFSPILNGACDRTHKGNARLSFSHAFPGNHTVSAYVLGRYERNNTDYSGSVEGVDKALMNAFQTGVQYGYANDRWSGSFGLGFTRIATSLNSSRTVYSHPYVDVSLRYVFNRKNVVSGVFHYSVWPPSANYKSDNVIQVSPFVWHTGNPLLRSHRSYDSGITYTFIPSNRFSLSAFAISWIVGDRAAFIYEATPYGIVRTLKQPIGTFANYNWGMSASTSAFDGKLHLSGRIEQLIVHNGRPYDVDHSWISYYVQALYYLDRLSFALAYQSDTAHNNYDSKSGVWSRRYGELLLQAGWSDGQWNVSLAARNPQRWHWRSGRETMTTENYSVDRCLTGPDSHALVQMSVTYTFGFGKKVSQDNDLTRQSGVSSGILK